mgnify:CR=1 FL=1
MRKRKLLIWKGNRLWLWWTKRAVIEKSSRILSRILRSTQTLKSPNTCRGFRSYQIQIRKSKLLRVHSNTSARSLRRPRWRISFSKMLSPKLITLIFGLKTLTSIRSTKAWKICQINKWQKWSITSSMLWTKICKSSAVRKERWFKWELNWLVTSKTC